MQLFNIKLSDKKALSRNPGRIYALAFFQTFLIIVPVAVPFFQSKGLSMQDVFLLQAVFGAVIALAEIPSGYLADLWGRRNALLLGAIFCGLGHSFLLAAQGFWTLVAFEACLGLGASLISGADIALLYDTKHALQNPLAAQQRSIGNLFFARSTAEAASAVLCSVLLLWSIDKVVLFQALVGWLPLAFACTIVEPPMERLPAYSHLENFRRVGKALSNSILMRLIVLALAFWSLTTFYALWLLQKYWENIGIPLIWFGYLWAGYAVLAGLSGRYADRAEAALGAPLMLIVVGGLPVLGYLGMAWTETLISLVFAATFFVARGAGLVTLRSALNRRIAGHYRATANSLVSFAFRGGFVITGPILGWMLDLWGMHAALYAAAGFAAVILFALMLPLALAAVPLQSAPVQPAPAPILE